MNILYLVLYLAAWLCFLIAALTVERPWTARVNLVALGLMFFTSVFLIHAIKAVGN